MRTENKGCYICGNPNIIDEHHVLPQFAGGQKGPTVNLCPNHHSAIHAQALSMLSKNPKKRDYLNDDEMLKAKPLVDFIVIAFRQVRDNPDMGQTMNLMLKPTRQLMTILHILKADAGFTNMQDFCLYVLTLYARSKLR